MPTEQYELHWKDYYKILQVHVEAEPEVILAAYRRLALMYHPDHNTSHEAGERFKDINEAKEVLSDPARRARYNQFYQARHGDTASRDDSNPHEAHWTSSHQEDAEAEDDGGWWYGEEEEAPEPEPQQPFVRRRYASHPTNLFSFAFLRFLVSMLLDRLAPNPDESQRILPWPSWKWQRVSLMASIPLACLLFFVGAGQGAWAEITFSLLLGGGAVSSGVATAWLRRTQAAPVAARIAGGASLTVSSVSWAVGLLYATLVVVVLVVMLLVACLVGRAMLEDAIHKS